MFRASRTSSCTSIVSFVSRTKLSPLANHATDTRNDDLHVHRVNPVSTAEITVLAGFKAAVALRVCQLLE